MVGRRKYNVEVEIEEYVAGEWARITSFFYAKASQRFQRKIIVGLCYEASLRQTEDRVMECIVLDYFRAIYRVVLRMLLK